MRQKRAMLLGFSFVELLITLGLILGMALLTYPFYVNYVRHMYFAEIIEASVPFKTAVADCYNSTKTFKGCDAGKKPIPQNIMKAQGHVASLVVKDGVITIRPVADKGVLCGDDLVFTPSYLNKAIVWIASGEAVKKSYAP